MDARISMGLLVGSLLAGCASAPSADEDVAGAPIGGLPAGTTVSLVRVEPLVLPIRWDGDIAAYPCTIRGGPCQTVILGNPQYRVGVGWTIANRTMMQPQGLFWRLNVTLEWETRNPAVDNLTFRVEMVKPCGDGCAEYREILRDSGQSPLHLDPGAIYLEEGEQGIRLTVEAPANWFTAWQEAKVKFHAEGIALAYVPVADAVVFTVQEQGKEKSADPEGGSA